jgi:cytochrome c oxidase subunit II
MGFYVFADPRAKFAKWLRTQAQPAKRFNALFDDKCSSCHAIQGTPARSHVGPDLTHIGSRTSLAALTIPNTPAHLAKWLRDPQQVKPGSQMPDLNLTDAQVRQLTRYLESLK